MLSNTVYPTRTLAQSTISLQLLPEGRVLLLEKCILSFEGSYPVFEGFILIKYGFHI